MSTARPVKNAADSDVDLFHQSGLAYLRDRWQKRRTPCNDAKGKRVSSS
jgi:hypothetical protein